MTRKDFELIARTIHELGESGVYPDDVSKAQKQTIAHVFANALASTNPRFDRDRFVRACLGQ